MALCVSAYLDLFPCCPRLSLPHVTKLLSFILVDHMIKQNLGWGFEN